MPTLSLASFFKDPELKRGLTLFGEALPIPPFRFSPENATYSEEQQGTPLPLPRVVPDQSGLLKQQPRSPAPEDATYTGSPATTGGRYAYSSVGSAPQQQGIAGLPQGQVIVAPQQQGSTGLPPEQSPEALAYAKYQQQFSPRYMIPSQHGLQYDPYGNYFYGNYYGGSQ